MIDKRIYISCDECLERPEDSAETIAGAKDIAKRHGYVHMGDRDFCAQCAKGPSIVIYQDDVVQGSGRWTGGSIVDCGAVFGSSQERTERIYDELDQAIAAGHSSIKIFGHTYRWELSR